MPAIRYECCPKCRHAPLPLDQSLPAACPACGLILAKFAAAAAAQDDPASSGGLDTSEGFEEVEAVGRWQQLRHSICEAVRYVPPHVTSVAFWGRTALLLAVILWGLRLIWMDYRTGEFGSSFLHGPLLVFHEAGHVIFRPFGEFMTVLGGTLGQLLMPAIMAGALLLRNRDPFGAAMGTWLFGVSVLDVAPYLYDALHPQLILLGGSTGEEGGHDWIYLLSETGLLSRAQSLGSFTHAVGALIVLLSLGWAAWILLQQKSRIADTAT
ncbi:MAG TPA: hypothetical protein VGN07_02965 [Steroidobacteraceae bacterium]|jgi:hypothetical protein